MVNPSNSAYPVGFYFKLSFMGEDAAFQEVSGISKELSTEDVVCGGENRFKYKLPGVATNQNLVLKRALVPVGSMLTAWCTGTIDQSLALTVQTFDVTVSLLAADGTVCAMWMFYSAYPVKYSVSDFKANENSIVIESIELAYTYFDISLTTTVTHLIQ
jgi:phage tail-like protein